MNIICICACAVISSVLALMLKRYNAEYSLVLAVCSAVFILMYIISSLITSINSVEEIFAKAKLNSVYIEILLKCVGICLITEFTCDCCKDASQNALSSVVLMSGRMCVLLTAFPLFEDFLSLTLVLTGGGE